MCRGPMCTWAVTDQHSTRQAYTYAICPRLFVDNLTFADNVPRQPDYPTIGDVVILHVLIDIEVILLFLGPRAFFGRCATVACKLTIIADITIRRDEVPDTALASDALIQL